jgi:hypothetical protein
VAVGTDVGARQEPTRQVDLLGYGRPAPLPFDPEDADRRSTYDSRPAARLRRRPARQHGHHAVVLSRDGVAATGSPWWVDSLDVADGETYEIVCAADNPGIWMDHCHDLEHAADGALAHLPTPGSPSPTASAAQSPAAATSARSSAPARGIRPSGTETPGLARCARGQRLCRASRATAIDAATRKSRRGSGTVTL